MKHAELIKKMTLEEKASLCSGKDFWHMKGIERLGIPSLMLTDGPHGLRKKNPEGDKGGLSDSVPTTCFPTAATTSCSWDPEMLEEMGAALGEECVAEQVSILLGPGVNMKRSPLCGRNFEYFSEEPLLAGELGAALVKGVQSKGVGTSLKHFACNSQEARRMTISEVVDERALREIYLPAFEITVKKSQPYTIMNAYNRVNGVFCSENEYLQEKILREEWGFEGLLVTDWGASVDRVKGMKNGTDLEMPSSGTLNTEKIVRAVKSGALDEEVLNRRADHVLDLIFKTKHVLESHTTYDKDAHHALARKIAANSAVLLKNEDGILPLKQGAKLAVVGEMAKTPRYQGAGSSLINPTRLDCACDALAEAGFDVVYSEGYDLHSDAPNREKIAKACRAVKNADVVLVYAGLPEEYEAEGFDRQHTRMPDSHNQLIEALSKEHEQIVVVLSGGSAMEMPWIGGVKGVLNGILGGQAGAGGVVDVLDGTVNPSGKLTETYPLKCEDNPTANYFPGGQVTTEHRESVYIGYRYYETAKKDVLFPFGFGLSYTQFAYSDLKLSADSIRDTDTLRVTFQVKNIGERDGAEVVQLYVADRESTIFRPVKELKGFQKVWLKAGEEKEITLTLDKRAFAYYNVNLADWHVESGKFDILIGTNIREIKLQGEVEVTSTVEADIPDYRETAPSYYTADVQNVPDKEFSAVLGHDIPAAARRPGERITLLNSLEDASDTKWGGRICKMVLAVMSRTDTSSIAGSESGAGMLEAMALQIPIRNFVQMSSGVFSEKMAEGLILMLNDEAPVKGVGKILAGVPRALTQIKTLFSAI